MTVLADTTARKLLLANTIDDEKMSVHLALPCVWWARWKHVGDSFWKKKKKKDIAAFVNEGLPDAVAKAAIANVRHTTMDSVMVCLIRTISSPAK